MERSLASKHRGVAFFILAALAANIVAAIPRHFKMEKFRADRAQFELLRAVGAIHKCGDDAQEECRRQEEAFWDRRAEVVGTIDALAGFDKASLKEEISSFLDLELALEPADSQIGKNSFDTLATDKREAIAAWFSTHTNLLSAAYALSDTNATSDVLAREVQPDEVRSKFFAQPAERAGILLRCASVLSFKAAFDLSAGDASSAGEALRRLERLAEIAAAEPTSIGVLVSYNISGFATNLPLERIEIWDDADLSLALNLAENAAKVAPDRYKRIVATCVFDAESFFDALTREVLRKETMRRIGLKLWIAARLGGRPCRAVIEEQRSALYQYMLESLRQAERVLAVEPGKIAGDMAANAKDDELRRVRRLPHPVRSFAPTLSFAIDEILDARCRAATIRVAVAAERYRRAHGGHPKSLGDLVPEYLDSVPLDPRTGSEIHCDFEPSEH